MAGRPRRRAQMQLADARAREEALAATGRGRNGPEVEMLDIDGYPISGTAKPILDPSQWVGEQPQYRRAPLAPPPRNQIRLPREEVVPDNGLRSKPPRQHNAGAAGTERARQPSPPPISAEAAKLFSEAREHALRIVNDFVKQDLSKEYNPELRAKLQLKQVEVASQLLALGNRVDPSSLRGEVSDEVGVMLAMIKGAA